VEQDIMNLKAFDGSVYHGRVFAGNQFYANQMRYALRNA
jgi:uridine phosphorylase